MIRTEPEAFSVLEDLDSRVRFHFDERISETALGGTLDEAVTVSPRTGEVSVGHSRSSLSVEIEGGFRPGLVYRVTLLPTVGDLFGNQLRDAFELVFSTGGEPFPTTVAGQVWDRITGAGVGRALVHAVGADSLVHVAQTGLDGIYAFRYLPGGVFQVTGFEDLDRDGEPSASEVRGGSSATVAVGDTLLLDIPILAPDTTPAVASSASALDSLTIVIEFDDYLEPGTPSGEIGVGLTREGGDPPSVARLYHEHEYMDFVEQVEDSLARVDSLAAAAAAARGIVAPPGADSTVVPDTVPADSVDLGAIGAPQAVPVADTSSVPDSVRTDPGVSPSADSGGGRDGGPGLAARRGPPALQGGGRSSVPGAPGRLLPGRRIVARLDDALEAGVEYQLQVTSVVNINGVPGGGGDVQMLLEVPVPDSASVAPDSASVAPDSGAIVPDTAAVRPDTAAAQPDTALSR